MHRFGISAWLTVLVLAMLPLSTSFAGDHAEAEGMILRQDGEVIVTVWEGVVTGEIEIHHEETTSDITVSFLDPEMDEFTPEVTEGFSLYAELADSSALTYMSTGDWTFTLTGDVEGVTGMFLGVFHEGHTDWVSPEVEVHVEEEHAEAEGLVLRQDGEVIVTVWEGVVTGEIEIHHEETTSDITVSFLDSKMDEFTPEVTEGFSLYAELADSSALTYMATGDWTFTLTGDVEGETGIFLGIFHEGHTDYVSPEIEVHVEEEHAEAEGLVIRQNGVQQVRVFEGVVEGTLYAVNGVTSDDFEVTFLDHDGDEFQPETAEGFLQWAEMADSSFADYSQSGDWTFTLHGLVNGSTGISLGIFHEGHLDYQSPVVPLEVLSPSSTDDFEPAVTEVVLNPPSPNPVRSMARLSFGLPQASRVDIRVFDATGRQDEMLMQGSRDAGMHSVNWQTGGVAEGVYFVRMWTPDAVRTSRVVVIAGR